MKNEIQTFYNNEQLIISLPDQFDSIYFNNPYITLTFKTLSSLSKFTAYFNNSHKNPDKYKLQIQNPHSYSCVIIINNINDLLYMLTWLSQTLVNTASLVKINNIIEENKSFKNILEAEKLKKEVVNIHLQKLKKEPKKWDIDYIKEVLIDFDNLTINVEDIEKNKSRIKKLLPEEFNNLTQNDLYKIITISKIVNFGFIKKDKRLEKGIKIVNTIARLVDENKIHPKLGEEHNKFINDNKDVINLIDEYEKLDAERQTLENYYDLQLSVSSHQSAFKASAIETILNKNNPNKLINISRNTRTLTSFITKKGQTKDKTTLLKNYKNTNVKLAQEVYSQNVKPDFWSLKGFFYGSAAGGTVGGLFGSVVPVIGTVIGAITGGFLGGIIGATIATIRMLKKHPITLETTINEVYQKSISVVDQIDEDEKNNSDKMEEEDIFQLLDNAENNPTVLLKLLNEKYQELEIVLKNPPAERKNLRDNFFKLINKAASKFDQDLQKKIAEITDIVNAEKEIETAIECFNTYLNKIPNSIKLTKGNLTTEDIKKCFTFLNNVYNPESQIYNDPENQNKTAIFHEINHAKKTLLTPFQNLLAFPLPRENKKTEAHAEQEVQQSDKDNSFGKG